MARSDRPADEGDGPDVDFVVGEADDGRDEDLPQPAEAGSRRRPLELGIGVLVLLVVVLIVRANLGGNSSPRADRATTAPASSSTAPGPSVPTPSGPSPSGPVTAPPLVDNGIIPSGEATNVPATPLPARVPTRHGPNPRACPGHRCTATTRLPAPVARAIHAAFPESNVEQSVTVRLRGGRHVLWYREVDVRVASELMVLRVEAPARGQVARGGFRRDDGQITTYYESSLGPWHVAVEVVDQLGGKAQLSQLRRLAGDFRVLSA